MSHFDRLHPALQHHIVNSLGWRALRPFQEAVIPQILDGKHLIILAPTAGGKTEAALLPVLSKMLSENWDGLSVLYICPIKALLNNLDQRLQRYCTLLGRRSALWHGDVKTADRKKILRDPPDCLLTTPESLEVMLVSPTVDARRLFAGVRVVIIDEVHAFAGDDRGWHLLSVLERIKACVGHELQRIGLSATVGNPEALVDWLAEGSEGPRQVQLPPQGAMVAADVQLDYVGSLQNAAIVVSRLHRGEKRLVFVDSRAQAEQLGLELQQLGVTAFVTHSSLSQDQRRQAEDAFANRSDCVIVATSVLELGIDVGDLDRVIQIDSPSAVSNLLQRMGRTGRRTGTTRNCLFLATDDDSLIQAAGLTDLWKQGYVEPVEPPHAPFHVLAQQLLALILQEQGIGRQTWFSQVERVPAFRQMARADIDAIVDHMLANEILWEDQGILGIGRQAEELYGRRHFLELMSVFLSPPLFRVLFGRLELGTVDETTFLGKQDGPKVLLLGGRPWRVTHIDWTRKQAFVEASSERGRSRWMGSGSSTSFSLCQAIRRILTSNDEPSEWSSRARQQMAEIRPGFRWANEEGTVLQFAGGADATWWTFGGLAANRSLASALSKSTGVQVTANSFALTIEVRGALGDTAAAIRGIRRQDPLDFLVQIEENAIRELKFSDCVPKRLVEVELRSRSSDVDAIQVILNAELRVLSTIDAESSKVPSALE